ECARYVDMYKIYDDIAKERTLTPDERKEAKYYSRLADALTPMAKGMGSEYCNQNAYDCIQVHGGSGFMKDYACERLYRDARITSIYEGTTQLQVVAAIRHVTTGTYLNLIRTYQEAEVRPELQGIKDRLAVLTERYAAAVEKVTAVDNTAYVDFMARRLVEMAGVLVMSYLLLADAQRNETFTRSLEVYVNLAEAEVIKHASFIDKFNPEEVGTYKID
ncbi:MAG: acyl-CoA dehydrogenase, partial [Duncaniella sp.]|nr:acyl-CoA dehydrogenase [Duncaniella sp.]